MADPSSPVSSAPFENDHLVQRNVKEKDLAPVLVVDSGDEQLTLAQEGDERRTEPPAPDGGYGWVVVFAVFVIHVVMDGITFSFGVLLPDLLDLYRSGKGETSWIMSVLIGTTYGCGPIPSLLAGRFGRRPIAIIGGILACLGAFLASFATAIWQLILLFGLLTGVGCGFLYLPAVVSVNHWFEKRRSMAVGIAVCGSGLGMMIFSPLTRYLLETYGVSGCLIVYAGILLNCCVFAALLRPTPAECQPIAKPPHRTDMIVNRQEMKELLPNDRVIVTTVSPQAGFLVRSKTWVVKHVDMDLMRQWRFWMFCLTAFFGGFSSYIPHAFLPDRAVKETRLMENSISKDDAAYLITAMGFANLSGRLSSSLLSDRPWLNRMIVYSCCCLIAGFSTCLSIFFQTYTMFMVYSVIYGFVGGYIIALQSVVLTDIVGLEKLNAAFGILLFLEGIAVMGPPSAGKLADHFDDYKVSFVVFGILMACAGISLLVVPTVNFFIRRRRRRITKVLMME